MYRDDDQPTRLRPRRTPEDGPGAGRQPRGHRPATRTGRRLRQKWAGSRPSRRRRASGSSRDSTANCSPWRRADGLEKPHLTSLPESYAAEFVVFEWPEFLLENFGYQGTNEAFQYYESVGWITEDAASELADYLLGIGKPAGDSSGGSGDIDDHKLSLVYIARLVSMH